MSSYNTGLVLESLKHKRISSSVLERSLLNLFNNKFGSLRISASIYEGPGQIGVKELSVECGVRVSFGSGSFKVIEKTSNVFLVVADPQKVNMVVVGEVSPRSGVIAMKKLFDKFPGLRNPENYEAKRIAQQKKEFFCIVKSEWDTAKIKSEYFILLDEYGTAGITLNKAKQESKRIHIEDYSYKSIFDAIEREKNRILMRFMIYISFEINLVGRV